MTAYAFTIPGGTICQRCGVFVTVVMACHHNKRLCNSCAFYEPCETCRWEEFDRRFEEQYGEADEGDELIVAPSPSKNRAVEIKDPRLT